MEGYELGRYLVDGHPVFVIRRPVRSSVYYVYDRVVHLPPISTGSTRLAAFSVKPASRRNQNVGFTTSHQRFHKSTGPPA